MAERFSVGWAEAAVSDLEAVVEHLAAEDLVAAGRLLDGLERRARTLESLPRRGRVVPELAALHVRGYRELLHGPYRLMYSVEGRRVDVLALLDGRRDLQSVIVERLLRGR
ncbi:MAG: type II toxin-antitoxin system RelE/ParE family toxin [Deltaproteobacteria bacterium]|nr:type II toxin-antitoxin system RelE/ParE family toxin [Deltaproteobacteria bacterium]